MSKPSRFAFRAAGALALSSALVLSMVSPAAAHPSRGDRAHFTLSVLHVNDPESHLLGAPSDSDYGGAARHTTLLRQLEKAERKGKNTEEGEARRRGVLKVSAGDTFLAGPQFAASLQEGAPFYDALALHYADYDAITIGNHEWDYGPELFAEFIEESPEDAPWLSSNLDVSPVPELAALAEEGRIAASTVVKERGEEIGIVGATTDRLHSISSPGDVIVDPDYTATIQAEVDALTAEGVDKIIVVSHLQGIVNDKILGRELTGVDLMIAGGGHETHARPDTPLVPGDSIGIDPETGEPLEYPLWVTDAGGEDVPIFTAGSDYKYVGQIVANFDRDGDLISVSERSDARRVSGVGDDAVREHRGVLRDITNPVQDYVDGLQADVAAVSEVALEGRREPGVRTQETNLGNLLADAQLAAGVANADALGVAEPQVALQNGGGIRNNSLIPAGEVTEFDTYAVAAFANFVTVVPEIPREDFRQLMERGFSGVPVTEGRFPQVAGMSIEYDATFPAQELDEDGGVAVPGERVRHLVLDDGTEVVVDGEVVDGDGVTMATIDFLANGGDGYPFGDLEHFSIPGVTYQAALSSYLREDLGGTITAADYPEGGEGRIVRLDS